MLLLLFGKKRQSELKKPATHWEKRKTMNDRKLQDGEQEYRARGKGKRQARCARRLS